MPNAPSEPNLVFLITDQQRADTLSRASLSQTPHLDHLAQRGVRLENCYSTNPICAPSRASLFTGLLPHNHGMVDNPHTVERYRADLVENLPFWPRDLQKAGYQTAYFGKWHVERSERLQDFGFTEYDSDHGSYAGYRAYRRSLSLPDKPAAPIETVEVQHRGYRPFVLSGIVPEAPEATLEHYITSRGINYLERQAESAAQRPWALFLSTLAPHDPYLVPREYMERCDPRHVPVPASFDDDLSDKPAIYRRIQSVWRDLTWEDFARASAAYYAFCSLIDDQVGRLMHALEQTGQAENTVIVYVSDHGDYLGEHRLMLKGIPAFELAYRVPCLLSGPGLPQGKTISERVNLLDLGVSMLPLLGLEQPASLPEHPTIGRSLQPLLDYQHARTADPSAALPEWSSQHFAECHGQRFHYTQRVLWWQDYKYVFNGFDCDELYNLAADPHEQYNLAHDTSQAAVLEEMAARMWQVMRQTNDKNMTEAEYGMFRFAPTGPHRGIG